jgi:thioredoxin 1
MGSNTTSAPVKSDRDLVEILRDSDRVIALFYLSWCPFCARFLPVFQKRAAAEEGRNWVFVQDDQEVMAERYAIAVYPTVLFFEKGAVSRRLDGVPGSGLDEKKLTEFIKLCPPA